MHNETPEQTIHRLGQTIEEYKTTLFKVQAENKSLREEVAKLERQFHVDFTVIDALVAVLDYRQKQG